MIRTGRTLSLPVTHALCVFRLPHAREQTCSLSGISRAARLNRCRQIRDISLC